MTIIGFATQFYTLWNVTTDDLFSTIITANGENHYKSGTISRYTYMKNISTDLEKVKALYPNAPIDESLRGMIRSFELTNGEKRIEYANDVFSKGMNRGNAIDSCNSIKELTWSFENEYSSDRLDFIKSKLIQLGCIFFEGSMYENQEEVNRILDYRNSQKEKSEKAENIYSKLANGGFYSIEFLKNLTQSGRYYDAINGISIIFKDFKVLEYNGFVYALPTINGVGKKVKGKTVELSCKAVEDVWSEYGGMVLLVDSFKM